MARVRSQNAKKSGFSLLEIMIAVVIMGILIVMITPQLLRASGRAQNTACAGNVRTISAALAEYQLIHGQLPTGNSVQQLQALVSDGLLSNDALSGNYAIQDTDANNISVTCLSPGGV